MNRVALKIALVAFAAFAFGIKSAGAQAIAAASVCANIVCPITIAKTTDMSFGNVAVQLLNGGTVVLSPAGARSATSGVTLPAAAGTVSAAQFTVTGQANYTYGITLPAFSVIFDAGQAHNIVVNTFTSTPSVNGTLSAAGAQTLNIGATLNVGSAQAAGAYTTTSDFIVSVNYN